MPPLARQGARRLRAASAAGAIVALGMAGITAMSDAGTTQAAVPAASPSTTTSATSFAQRTDRPNRDAARPSLGSTPSASHSSTPAKTTTAKQPKLTALKPVATATTSSPSATASTTARASAPAKQTVIGHRYTTVALNVRAAPDDDARLITVLPAGSRLTITDATSGSYRGIVHQGHHRWVHGQYLVRAKPTPTSSSTKGSSSTSSGASSSGSSAGISAAACASGSSMESGLTPDAIRVHRAVCHAFPQITSYGGVRAGGFGEHGSGRAVDCMLPNGSADNALGWQVARWVRAHAGELGVSEVIFDSHIWTVQRSSEGWRSMSDRGGDTANHRDHVHVTVYGSSGTS